MSVRIEIDGINWKGAVGVGELQYLMLACSQPASSLPANPPRHRTPLSVHTCKPILFGGSRASCWC